MPKPKQAPRWLTAARARDLGGHGDWLSRALARAGVLPLTQAEQAIREGRVRLDGRKETEPMAPVHASSRAALDGQAVSLAWRTQVLQFHKPAGVVSHGHESQTVFDALRAVLPMGLQNVGWHAVGRLDRDTTGLLLFTNDEKFVAHATLPETHLRKRYVARVGTAVQPAQLESLRRGVKFDGENMSLPAQARARGDDSVELVLTEGRFHQVKRMLNAVGLPTLSLHREAVGTLELDVPVGAYRLLTDDEVKTALGFTLRSSEVSSK